jgi:enoyl-CoA hydratase/carnithine racemase
MTGGQPGNGEAPAVSWAADGQAFIVTMTSPSVNQLGARLVAGLTAALDAFEDSDARVLIVASGIGGFFAAGADIKLMAGADLATFRAYSRSLRTMLDRIVGLSRPSIVAIDGRALGGGLELALACSLRVGTPAALAGLPEPKLGLIPGAGGTQRLPRLIGRGRALDLLLTGREVGADEALAMGLLSRLAPGDAVAEAIRLAGELAALSGPALEAVLRCVDDAGELPLPDGLAREAARVEQLFDSDDGREGLAAFLARRPPRFG